MSKLQIGVARRCTSPEMGTILYGYPRQRPTQAIHGVIKQPFVIEHDKCIKCGTCMMNCKFGAIAIKD